MPKTEACHCRHVRPVRNSPKNKTSLIGGEAAPKFKSMTFEAGMCMKTKKQGVRCEVRGVRVSVSTPKFRQADSRGREANCRRTTFQAGMCMKTKERGVRCQVQGVRVSVATAKLRKEDSRRCDASCRRTTFQAGMCLKTKERGARCKVSGYVSRLWNPDSRFERARSELPENYVPSRNVHEKKGSGPRSEVKVTA
jgi:hypothetical protein